MIEVEFMGPISKQKQTFDVDSLEKLKDILQKDKELASWLEMCAVAVNDEIVGSLKTPLQDGDKVTLLPPVCGG